MGTLSRCLAFAYGVGRPGARSVHRALPFEVDANVAKDVVLFRYENPRLYRLVTFFGLGQYFFWMYLTHFANSSLRDAPVVRTDAPTSWWRNVNLGDHKYRVGLTGLFFVLGNVVLGGAWLFSTRSVRYLVLQKGGRHLQILTYMPFVHHRVVRVPLDAVSCSYSRNELVSHLPLKVKGRWFYFILDRRGTFPNAKLFDCTAGMKRT